MLFQDSKLQDPKKQESWQKSVGIISSQKKKLSNLVKKKTETNVTSKTCNLLKTSSSHVAASYDNTPQPSKPSSSQSEILSNNKTSSEQPNTSSSDSAVSTKTEVPIVNSVDSGTSRNTNSVKVSSLSLLGNYSDTDSDHSTE